MRKRKYWDLGTSVTRSRRMAYWMQQRRAPWCLFNSSTRKAGSTNVILRHLPLEVIGKGVRDEETLFNFSDGFEIRDFSNVAIVLYKVRIRRKVKARPNGIQPDGIVQPVSIRSNGTI